jgi:hypothetical protein
VKFPHNINKENSEMKGLSHAIKMLSKNGVSRDNLYKFFLPSTAKMTVEALGLDITPEQLSEEWKKVEDNFYI